jgi:IclR family transcriptional regulator, acetate operon repressor
MASAPETTEADSPSLRAVERVCDILDLLQENPEGLSLTDIAERTQLPKSTAYRYLVALERRNYIDRDDNMMRLGFAFRPRSGRDIEQFLVEARPLLLRLRDETGETINLGLLDGGRHRHSVVVESEHIMRLAAREGEHGMLHSTAIGKVLAAGMDPEAVRTILLSEGMPRLTEWTITDADEYLAELDRVRENGYALDDCENQDGGRCIAVEVEGLPVRCGLSISAPTNRFPVRRVTEFAERLHAAAAELTALYQQQAGDVAV